MFIPSFTFWILSTCLTAHADNDLPSGTRRRTADLIQCWRHHLFHHKPAQYLETGFLIVISPVDQVHRLEKALQKPLALLMAKLPIGLGSCVSYNRLL